jgi:tape measure domain-containing protein
MNYARGVAGKYSISAQPALENYTKLSVAARGTKLEGEGIKDLYEGISASIKALNLGTYDSQLIFNAYTQILSKGKVSMEELRQQLGEKFPPAMNVFAKALGVSVPQLTELSSKGALLSEDVLPKVAKVLKTDFGAAAESAAGGFTSAISRMENAGFDLNIKLTKSFDGLFGGVTNLAAGMFETFNKNFDNIAKVGAAFLIGFTAQIAVATQTIMQAPAIASKMGMVQNLFIASFKKSILTLTPFFVGVFSDIADDFLGAKHSVMENMFQGVGNMFVSLFTGIDQQFRDAFDKSLFTPSFGKEKKSLFEDIKDAVMGLFRILPPGLVEMGALLVMFEQSAVLGKMLLTPMFNNLGNAVKGVSGAFTNAFRDGNTLKQSLRTLIADSSMAKGAMIALGVAAKAALALAVIAFARSDFSNPIEAAFNKTKGAMASSIDEIKTALEGLKQKSVEVGNTIKDSIKLPSKGLELNPLVWLGLSESNYRSDDFIRDVNDTNKPNNTNKVLFESSVAATATTLKTFTPFLNPIFDRVKSNSEKDVTNKKKKADEMGVGSFFTGEEQILTLGQNQLFNQASDLSRQAKELKQQLANLNLSSDTIGNFISGDVKASLDGLRKIDSEIESLGEKRSKLALADDSESKKQVKVLDDQINNLIKQRKDKQKPLTAVLGGVDDIKEQLAEQEKAINDSSLPKTAKKALLAILEPQKQMIDESVNYLKQKGLYQALEPLADVWLKVVERLKDAEKAFDKLKKTSRVDNLNKQAAIYSSNDTEANKKRNLDLLQIKELTTNKERLSMMLNLRQTSLNKLLTIPNVEQNKEKKEEISKLRENVDKDREELANTNLQIAQAKNTLLNSLREQTKQVAEYYQNIVKQVKESKIEFQKQLNQLNTMKAQNKIKAALTDVGDNIFTQFADSLVQNLQELNDIKQTKLDVQSRIQGLDFQIDDVKKQAFELKRSLPGNAKGFDSDAVKDLNRELTNTQDISEIINDNTKELDNLLQQNINNSSDLDKQFRELTNTTEDTSKSIENLDKSSNDWKGSLTSIVSVTGDVNKGFEGIGSNIANIAGQTATWIGQLMTGQGLMQGLNSGVATIMNPETQKQNPVIGNTFNTLKNFFGGDAIKREGYKIVESVGSRIENVNSFDDLAKHHPSSGREHGRNYETINGQLEEIRKTSDGRTLIKKDFVLMDSKGNQNVAIPAPASGYVKASSNFGMVDIYEDEKMTKLLAKALHLSNIAVKTGDQVKYGQTIGTQDGIGRNGKREYAVHAHIELEAERFKEYIPDLIDGKFDFNGKGSTASVSHTKPNNNGNTKQIKRGGNDLTSQEYAKLTPQGKQLYDLRNNPNILAIADAVARSEGTDFRSNSKNFGYGMLIGNENISDFSGHPFVEGGRKYRHNSSASGRYQMMDFNYSKSRVQKQFGRGAKTDLEAVINYGGKDNPGTFSPGLQDLYFIQSLKSRGVLDQVLNGQITPSVLNKLAPHYASIQSGSRRSAYGGQGTPEGQHSNFLSFVNKRKSEAVDNPAMAAYTQGKVINPNAMQGLVTQGSNMQIQNLTQQKEIVGQTNDAEIANKRADFLRRNNQALRAFRRGLRDSQDNSLQSSRELEDTKNNIVENKSPGEQFQGKVNQMNRDFEDKIKARERKLIELEDQIKAARNLLGTGSLDTNQKVEVEKGLDQSLKEKSQYEAEVKKLIALKNTAFKESRTLFDKQESFRERQITFEETSQEINQMREKLEQLKAIQEPLAPQNKEILSLQKTISLKETQLDLDKQIAEIQQKILRKELTDEQGQKQIDNLKAVNEEKRKNIELSSRQAELEQNVKDIENRNTFEKTKTDFLTSRMFTKRDKQMDLMRSRGMNEFTINAFGRKNGKEQEEIRYQEELREFEAETARLKLQGIDIDPEALDRVRADMEAIHNLNLEGINNQFKTFGQTLDDIARNSVQGLSQGFTDLIMGTKSLNDVLDSFFDNILSQVLNTAFSSLLGGLTGGGMFGGTGGLLGGIFYAGGIVPNYANGGIHKALNKERSESGRKPMLVVAHEGEMMIPAWRMQELSQLGLGEKELLGYADGGVIGNMRSPAPNRANSGLEVKYDATVINNQSYVTAEQFEQGIKQAAQAGAEGGLQRMQNKLANSSSFRRSVGI